MKVIYLIALALLHPVSGAVWKPGSREIANSAEEASEVLNGPRLEKRAAICTATTTRTYKITTTRTAVVTSTATTTRTVKSTSTRTAVVTSTATTTRTVKTTSTVTRPTYTTLTTTRTYKTTITKTAMISSTTTFTTTRTRKTTITQTATTCPTTTCAVCPGSSTSATTTTVPTTDSTPTPTSSASCTGVGDLVTLPDGGAFQNFYSGYGAGIPRSVYDTDYANHPPRATWYDPAHVSICDAMNDCAAVTRQEGYNTIQFYMDVSSQTWICSLSWTSLQDPSLFISDNTKREIYGYYYVPGPGSTTAVTTTSAEMTTTTTTTSATASSTDPCPHGDYGFYVDEPNNRRFGFCPESSFVGDNDDAEQVPVNDYGDCVDECGIRPTCVAAAFAYGICYIHYSLPPLQATPVFMAIVQVQPFVPVATPVSSTTTTSSPPTTTTIMTTTTTTTTSSNISTPPGTLPTCSPVKDASFENASQSQLDGQPNYDPETEMARLNYPYPAGDWLSQIDTQGGAGSGVTANGETWAHDGLQEAVFSATSAATISTYQDLVDLNGIYSLSYYYSVLVVYSGSPCTFQVKLGDTVLDSFQVSSDMAVGNAETLPYTQRTVPQTSFLSGTLRLSFNYICPDPNTYSVTFFDEIDLTIKEADPGVNCVESGDSSPPPTTTTATTTEVVVTTTTTVPTTSAAAPTCAYTAPYTRTDTASNGQRYLVNVDAFYSDYAAGDRIGDTIWGVPEQHCLDTCESTDGCRYFIYSPNYAYCEIYRDRAGGYCQSPSSDFISGGKTTSTGSAPTTGTSSCNAVIDGSFEEIPQSALYAPGTTAGEWRLVGQAYFESNANNAYQTSFGSNFVTLYGSTSSGSVSQIISGLAGQYVLEYSYSVLGGFRDMFPGSRQCDFTVTFDNAVIDSFSNPPVTGNAFTTRSVTFSGFSSGDLTFGFTCEGGEDGSDLNIDNISVKMVGGNC